MSYKVEVLPNFAKSAKRLAKKYPSLKGELSELFASLSENPRQGALIRTDIHKIRLAIASRGKGKSGGGRVITYVISDEMTVVLLSIYDKSEMSDISDEVLVALYEEAMERDTE